MSQWKETQEPYVKVYERVKSTTLNPSAGESLIIGITLISDSGPSIPTLINGQSEFISTYASKDITKDYLDSLNKMYSGADKTLASTMWSNAYRLSGSNTLLVCRASKANDINFSKPFVKGDMNDYILRDGALMKKVGKVKFVLDINRDDAEGDKDGWLIAINGVGTFGNRVTDEGPQYDYFVNSLPDLVDTLNDTPKFFSPSYEYYSDEKGESPIEVDPDNETSKGQAISVIFDELYLGVDTLDISDPRCDQGLSYIIVCQPDWDPEVDLEERQKLIELNSTAFSGFEDVPYYASNVYNSSTDLRVRIRRFNHDAVSSKELSSVSLNESSESPWTVLESVLNTFTKNGQSEPSSSVIERDFYEICVLDPSVSAEPLFFNVGNIPGRGDMTVSEVNDSLRMISLQLPDDLRELGLNYYGYKADDNIWVEVPSDTEGADSPKKTVDTYELLLQETEMSVGDIYKVTAGEKYYQYQVNGEVQMYADLSIDPTKYKLLSVSDTDLKKALDQIVLDEVYVTEGLCDLGNTEPSFQSYMANIAINDNYFYPISTVNSTNYMTIANSASKISQDSYKLYMSAPWDVDSGTLGWKTYMSPSVLYWEAVARNRRGNNEFRAVLGQEGGIVQYQKPVTEFNKKTRQLLLSKKINTVLWNTQTSAWNMNDNYTKQSTDTIMSDEGNSRLAIRISKAMPTILRQFIGRKISERLWADARGVIDYYFKSNILPMGYSVDDYYIQIDETNNPEEIQRQNKMVVTINVRYPRTLKYVEVYHNILDVGMDIEDTSFS